MYLEQIRHFGRCHYLFHAKFLLSISLLTRTLPFVAFVVHNSCQRETASVSNVKRVNSSESYPNRSRNVKNSSPQVIFHARQYCSTTTSFGMSLPSADNSSVIAGAES